VADKGAVSRPSSVVTSPVSASYQTRNAPPPMPELCGSTNPRTVCTATMASAAVPPARSTSAPASTANGLAAEIIQSRASTGRPLALAACASTTCGEVATAPPPAPSGATVSAACCACNGKPETRPKTSAASSFMAEPPVVSNKRCAKSESKHRRNHLIRRTVTIIESLDVEDHFLTHLKPPLYGGRAHM